MRNGTVECSHIFLSSSAVMRVRKESFVLKALDKCEGAGADVLLHKPATVLHAVIYFFRILHERFNLTRYAVF